MHRVLWHLRHVIRAMRRHDLRLIPDICHRRDRRRLWRKIVHVEKFSPWHVVKWKISPHDKCGETLSHGEISPHYKCGEICQVENFSTWERWRKSVMWRNFSSWEMWRKYVKSALSNCLKMALYHQGQQIRLLSNKEAQGGTAQPTFLLLNLSVISFSITI